MKLAIVREMWTRYTSTITETLEAGIRNFLKNCADDSSHLNEIIIDKMAELQAANPAFIEIWSCVTASIDLRALNAKTHEVLLGVFSRQQRARCCTAFCLAKTSL